MNRGSFFQISFEASLSKCAKIPGAWHNSKSSSNKSYIIAWDKTYFAKYISKLLLQFLTPLAQSFVFNSYERLRSFLKDLNVRKGLNKLWKTCLKTFEKKMAHRACEAKLRRVLPKGCYLWGLKNIFKLLLPFYYILHIKPVFLRGNSH